MLLFYNVLKIPKSDAVNPPRFAFMCVCKSVFDVCFRSRKGVFLTLNNTLKKNGDFFVNKFAFLKALCYNDKRGYFDFR